MHRPKLNASRQQGVDQVGVVHTLGVKLPGGPGPGACRGDGVMAAIFKCGADR